VVDPPIPASSTISSRRRREANPAHQRGQLKNLTSYPTRSRLTRGARRLARHRHSEEKDGKAESKHRHGRAAWVSVRA
jgi:hypothetical protein